MFRSYRAQIGCVVLTLCCTLLAAQTWPTTPATDNGANTCCLDTNTNCCPAGDVGICSNIAGQCKGIGFYASSKGVDKQAYGVCDSQPTDLHCTSYSIWYCCKSNTFIAANCEKPLGCILFHGINNGCNCNAAGKCP